MDKKLTDEEKSLFAEAVEGAKRLNAENKVFLKKKSNLSIKSPKRWITSKPQEFFLEPQPVIDLHDLAEEDWVGIDKIIKFNRSGLQNKLLKKLAQGKIHIDAKLDLHLFHASGAISATEHFLSACHEQNLRFALIVHGKGRHAQKPILKNILNIWLRTQKRVLAFHSAQAKDGGTGALYVIVG